MFAYTRTASIIANRAAARLTLPHKLNDRLPACLRTCLQLFLEVPHRSFCFWWTRNLHLPNLEEGDEHRYIIHTLQVKSPSAICLHFQVILKRRYLTNYIGRHRGGEFGLLCAHCTARGAIVSKQVAHPGWQIPNLCMSN